MKYKIIIAIVIVILAILVGSIFLTPASIPLKPKSEKSFPVVDDTGREITIKGIPKRIVSLSPSNTEVLFALGLEGNVVGVTSYCDYPPEVKNLVTEGKISVIGGFANPNIERIVDLKPDLIIAAAPIQNEIIKTLENNGLTVVTLNPKNIEGIINDVLLVGKITGKTLEAEKLATDMKLRINAVTEKVAQASNKPHVYYEIWNDPLMSVGSQSFLNELIFIAGGVNIFNDSSEEYPIVSSESVISRKPQVIFISLGYMGGVGKDNIKVRSGWEIIEAVRDNNMYEIDEDTVFRTGPRIVDGLETLASNIHPELFR